MEDVVEAIPAEEVTPVVETPTEEVVEVGVFNCRVKEALKTYTQADNAEVYEVVLEVLDEAGEVVEEKRLGFPLDTSEEDLKAEIQKFINTYNLEKRQNAENAKRDEIARAADETIANVTGLEFTPGGTNG